MTLTSEEAAFNDMVMAEKMKEMEESFETARFPPAFSFLESWEDYEKSKVFQIIKTLPKGGILHIHDISMTTIDWLVNNATYRDNLYMKKDNTTLNFKFMEKPLKGWEKIQDLREQYGATEFDKVLKQEFMMGNDSGRYETINDAWNRFTYCLIAAAGIIEYKPVFIDYYERALSEFLADGVQYVEIRATLSPLYELDGTSVGPIEVADLFKEITDKFAAAHDDWCGTKLIFAPV